MADGVRIVIVVVVDIPPAGDAADDLVIFAYDLDGVVIPECVAIVRVYWSPGDAPPKVDKTVGKAMRGARLCSCYGALVFMVLFFIAILWEWLF